MEIDSRFAGTLLKAYKTVVSARAIMNCAAAIGDGNPFYLDDEREGGIVAPPMYAAALTWPVIERIWKFIDDKDFPHEVLATMVHYSEHIEFHRPIRPGDNLMVHGKIAAIVPHRAGTVVTLRFDARVENGSWVFTEHMGALLRGVGCAGGSRGTEDLPAVPGTPEAGNPEWDASLPTDPLAAHIYDGCTGIHFPIHTSPAFARQVGLPSVVYQGTATLARAVKEIVDREAGGDPTRLRVLSCRFSGMVFPGASIRVRMLCRGASGARSFDVTNDEGRRAISAGLAIID